MTDDLKDVPSRHAGSCSKLAELSADWKEGQCCKLISAQNFSENIFLGEASQPA